MAWDHVFKPKNVLLFCAAATLAVCLCYSISFRSPAIIGNLSNLSQLMPAEAEDSHTTERSISSVFYPAAGSWLPVATLERLPPDGCVFLLELSGREQLTPREWCAVESAARAHPARLVVLLTLAPRIRRRPLTESLLAINNTRLARLDFARLFADTPLESWYQSRAVLRSRWPVVHMSDAVRLSLVFKFGGIYLDTDVVVRRSMDDLMDGAGMQDETQLNNAVLKFRRHSLLVRRLLEEYAAGFDPGVWGANGPVLLTRVMKEFCDRNQTLNQTSTNCGEFAIYDRQHFYPVPWTGWSQFLEPAEGANVLRIVNVSHVVHMWGKFTREKPVRKGSAYFTLAEKYCPTVFTVTGTKL